MYFTEMRKIAEQRRSIRQFKDKAIGRDEIENIVQVGMLAPSGYNSQPWEIFVIDQLEMKNQIAQWIIDFMGDQYPSGFAKAPVLIILYGDTRVREFGPLAKKDDDEWWNYTFNTSLSNCFMSMQLAAASLELGCMWISPVKAPTIEKKIKDLLQVPDYFELFEMMAVGYADEQIGPRKLRDTKEVLHYNGC